MKFHEPALLQEIDRLLPVRDGDWVIDATAGGGGHTLDFLRRGARVLALDRDPEAVEYVRDRIQSSELKTQNLILVRGNFAQIGKIAKENGVKDVRAILFDLGVSSHQLEKAERGFSFAKQGPLDMRMDKNLKITAQDIINHFDERRLNEIFSTFGQEKFSRAIAISICRARQIRPIKSTTDLSEIIEEVYEKNRIRSKLHSATKVFQALRIVVNSELLNLEESLPQTVGLLRKGGRLAIISFHSLEDAIVKRFFKEEKRLEILTKKPIGPQPTEINRNPRARSAKLRVAKKI